MSLFGKSNYTFIKVKRKEIPAGVWTKCPGCESPAYSKELKNNLNVCPKCGFHLSLNALERIEHLIDEGSFVEHDGEMTSADPLKFQGPKSYKEKLKADQEATDLKDAVITGHGEIEGKKIGIAVTDSRFIMGSMGSVVGERITRIVEYATKQKLPVIIVSKITAFAIDVDVITRRLGCSCMVSASIFATFTVMVFGINWRGCTSFEGEQD